MKTSIDDLAIFGGSPFFNEKLHVGSPNLGNRQRLLERINDLLDRKWLTNGGCYVQELEKRIADFIGVKHCILTCNATIALQLAARAIGLTGEVIVPSFTFVATAHAFQWEGITPVFCDVDSHTHNIDPSQVEAMITPYTSGIVGVHLWGRPCDIESLVEIGRNHNVAVLFDAAHAFGCSDNGRMIGSFGLAEVFSFHATKFINTFEGGAIVTNHDELAEKLRLMKNFGFANYDSVASVGINGKMSEVSAAMGLTSLEDMNQFVAVNRRNWARYRMQLAGIPGIDLIAYDEDQQCNYQYIVLDVDKAVTYVSRNAIQKILWNENVLARRYFYPGCHRMEPYASRHAHKSSYLPNTDGLVDRVLCLPTGTNVEEEHVDKICHVIRLVVENGAEIKENLAARGL